MDIRESLLLLGRAKLLKHERHCNSQNGGFTWLVRLGDVQGKKPKYQLAVSAGYVHREFLLEVQPC